MSLKFTNEDLARTVTERHRIPDAGRGAVSGLYASKTPNVTTINLRYYDRTMKKQRTVEIGRFDAKLFNVDLARAEARKLTNRVVIEKADIAGERHVKATQAVGQAMTFDQLADKYIAYISEPIDKPGLGKLPRVETFFQVASHLTRARAAFGKRPASSITADDVQPLLDGIVAEGHAPLANKVRGSINSMYKWSAGPGRRYTTVNPCASGSLEARPDEDPQERVLTRDELRTVWHAMDRTDLPCSRRIALAYKLIIATMLRPGEVISARRSEIGIVTDEDGGDGKRAYRIPPVTHLPNGKIEGRVKKRRVIVQPLNSLADEIIAELLTMETEDDMLFPQGDRGGRLDRCDLALALRGREVSAETKHKFRINQQIGLCEFLGIAPFTPHDLRATSATMLGMGWEERGIAAASEKDIDRCLDHRPGEGKRKSTSKRYNKAEQILNTKRRRPTLEHLDTLLRAIVGLAPAATVVPFRKAG